MKKQEVISHRGRIVEITPEFTTVEIISQSACSECHAKGLCGLDDSVTKAISVPSNGWEQRNVGDEVEVCLKRTMGLKAVWISYVIPLLVLMILILSLSKIIESELAVGGIAIAGVGLYYFAIWLLRDRLAKDYVFYIK